MCFRELPPDQNSTFSGRLKSLTRSQCYQRAIDDVINIWWHFTENT